MGSNRSQMTSGIVFGLQKLYGHDADDISEDPIFGLGGPLVTYRLRPPSPLEGGGGTPRNWVAPLREIIRIQLRH